MIENKKWTLVMENIADSGNRSDKSGLGQGWWLRMMIVLGVGVILSRLFFLQVVLGEEQKMVAEGNRLERVSLVADRGAVRDRAGRVVARNIMKNGKVVREYPYGEFLAHAVGYVGEVEEPELEADESLSLGEVVGKIGLEKSFDRKLRGINGEELVEVDVKGQVVRVMGVKEAIPGRILDLSLDAELSKKIVEVLVEREKEKGPTKGAVVVSRVGTGKLLALVSYPSFDPNLFSGLESKGRYSSVGEVLGDKVGQPMFDRVVGGSYPPGSIFKLVTAVSGLEEGKIDVNTRVLDEGEIKLESYRYGNWYFDQYGKTEGELGLVKAIARSNDIFFYKVGEWVGVEKLGKWAKKLGLGRKTGIGLGAEASGRVPDPLWKEKLTGERWFLGNTYHMAIGQGDLEITPLQGNLMTAAVVVDKWCVPSLIKDFRNSCVSLGIKRENREMIVEGMRGACSEGGTGFTFFDFLVPVACKTGTAQHGGKEDEPHAWITAIVPNSQYPEASLEGYENGVVITVLLEAGGEGSKEAGPVAMEIAKYVVEQGI